jgi:hypothetical protein
VPVTATRLKCRRVAPDRLWLVLQRQVGTTVKRVRGPVIATLLLPVVVSGCCGVFGTCPPVRSQTSYYDALKIYASSLNSNVFHDDPQFEIVPVTGVMYPIGTIMVDGNGVNACVVAPSLLQNSEPMAPQPPVVWNTSAGLSGSVPASMLGGLATAGLTLKANSSASLSMGEPITEDEVRLDDFQQKVATDPACLQAIAGRRVDLVRGLIKASEKWSWDAGTTVSANAQVGPTSAGPGFALDFASGNVPVAIEETSASPRFFVVTPIPAQPLPIRHGHTASRFPLAGAAQGGVQLKVGGTADPANLDALSPH